MIRLNGFVLLSTVLFCFLSCGEEQKPPSPSYHHIESGKLKFAFDYDTSWLVNFKPDSSQPGSLTTLQSSLEGPDDSYQEKVEIYYEGLPMRIPDSMFHQAAITQIKLINPDLDVRNEGPKLFGKNHFREYRFQFNVDSSAYIVHGYTLLNDSIGYTINYTSALNDEKKFMPKVEQILTSFKPIEK